MPRLKTTVNLAILGGITLLVAFCCWHTPSQAIREGLENRAKGKPKARPKKSELIQRVKVCGCDPWSEHCVVPPHDSPGYGCIRAFDDHDGGCGDRAQPNDGPWLEWGFGHGHPLTKGHTEGETKRIASAVFGEDSNITRQLKNEAVRRDARRKESHQSLEQGDALKRLPDARGLRDLSLHTDPPTPALQCGSMPGSSQSAAKQTAQAVYADPVTTFTDMPVHLPTAHDLRPHQSGEGGKCRPSVTGIFQVCGPLAADD